MAFYDLTQAALDSQRSIAYDIMGTAIRRGLSVLRAVRVGTASVYDTRLETAFLSIGDDLEAGMSITEAMRETGFGFYDYEYEEIGKGEVEGKLDDILRGLAERLNSPS